MSLEIKTISVSLSQLSNLQDLVFDGPINEYVYGLSSFCLSYDEGDRNDVLELSVQVSMTPNIGANNRLSPSITAVLKDNSGNTADPDNSWVSVTVVASTGSDYDYFMGNSAMGSSDQTNEIEPGAKTYIQLPLISGFVLTYDGSDHQITTISASTTLNISPGSSKGIVTSLAEMRDSSENFATGKAQGGYLCSTSSNVGVVSTRLNGQQTTDAFAIDFGTPLSSCAAFLSAFTVCYPDNEAHMINNVTIGVGTKAGSVATISSSDNSVVSIPCAQSKVASNGHDDYSDDKKSSVDIVVLAIKQEGDQ